MKTAVFSDSHGNAKPMIEAIRSYCPDNVIHLGDGKRDIEEIEREFPLLPICSVPGNCDYGSGDPDYRVINFGEHRVFITHGHRYGVKYSGFSPLLYAAECNDCDIAMFGHTHEPMCTDCDGILLLNPGSIGYGSSWAKLNTDGEEVSCELVTVD